MRKSRPPLELKAQKAKVFIFSPLVIGCLLFLNFGCSSSYEFTAYEGHPANINIYEPAYRPSQTLVKTEPIDTQPARSEQWTEEEEEEHDHDQNHHHEISFIAGGLIKKECTIKLDSFFPFSKYKRPPIWLHSFTLPEKFNRHQKSLSVDSTQNVRDGK